MTEDEKQNTEKDGEQEEAAAASSGMSLGPTEKLGGVSHVTGSLIPGAQNPESEEIKKEINPNTE